MRKAQHACVLGLFVFLRGLLSWAGSVTNVVHLTPLDVRDCLVEGLTPLPLAKGLFEGAGTLESPAIETDPFDELVGSWSARLPGRASLEMRAQVRVDGAWSKWYALGRWDHEGGRSLGEQADALGKVDVDTLKLARPADAFRYRVTTTGKVRLARVAAALSRSGEPAAPSQPFRPGPWVRELDVPLRSQMEEQEKYKHDICSPTSLSMVLQHWGFNLKTVEVAEGVRDKGSLLFGNWPLNVAYAGRLGLAGHVARLEGLAGLEREIAAGRPVITSITFGEGELDGSPIKKTKGHLIVASGFTKDGDVIVRDPAAKTRREVRRVYKRAQFEKVWAVKKRGLSYVLGEPFPQELVVGVPSTELRRKPKDAADRDPHDPERASQLLYGERVRVLGAKGAWAQVEALEQDAFLPAKAWHPFRGWVRADALRWPVSRREPNASVAVKRLEAKPASGASATLPLGALVHVEARSGANARLVLPDGRRAEVPSSALRELGRPPEREKILAAARRLLGDVYVWGGRSTVQPVDAWGTDCSGLASLAYRVEGVSIPRDAHEQFLKAKPVKRRQLEPGDLLFLTEPGQPDWITHVMLYTGGDGILESRKSAGKTLETTFKDRFGRPLEEIESGAAVTDYSGAKPVERKIHFGSFLAR